MSFETVFDIVRSIARYRERRELLPAIVEAVRRTFPADGYVVAIKRRRDGEPLDVYSEPAIGKLPNQCGEFPSWLRVPCGAGHPRATRLYEANASNSPVLHEVWQRHGVGSALLVPLAVETALVGAISAWSRDPHAFDATDLEVATELGTAVGVVIDSCLAYEHLARRRHVAGAEELPSRDALALVAAIGDGLVGRSAAISAIRRQIEVVGPTDATVLLTGESGTGKEVVARAIHAVNGRRDRPLVTVNCAAIPANLAETELFGHEEGAFTGATRSHAGRFEQADGGTLFLDEVGELPLPVQAKLLRVLQERELERVGGSSPIKIDVRIIAATNRDLQQLLAANLFREDLYFRLAVFPIHLPPLRSRLEDLRDLVEHFIELAAERFRVQPRRVTPEVIRRLAEHEWPGNVRELQHAIERAMIVSPAGELSVDMILPHRLISIGRRTDSDPLRRDYLAALEATGWVIEGAEGAAAQLGLHPNTLRHRLRRLGIVRPAGQQRRA